jgi:hypothetical protein
MKRFSLRIAVAGFAVAPLACYPFFPDQSVILGVERLDAPTTISTGSSLTVTVTVTTGGCLSFRHFEVERQASFASLTAWGRDAAKGRKDIACPADIRSEPHSYTFEPPFQSPFTVQVQRGSLNPLTATVQVQ